MLVASKPAPPRRQRCNPCPGAVGGQPRRLVRVRANPFERIGETHGAVVLDGGLATELERRGADLRDPLWSAKVLVEEPDAIRRVHEAYFEAAAGGDRVVAASVGPYGAMLGNGAEYTGDYDKNEGELVEFHVPRLEALAEAGPDVFAVETIPSFVEARALARALGR